MKILRALLITAMALLLLSPITYAASLVNGLGGATGFGENTLAANDDSYTGFLNLSSVFPSGMNFFGNTYTGLRLNNNGNVTFNSALGTFTPYNLTGPTGNPIIAPFFADVDTRGGAVTPTPGGNSTGSNLVHWDLNTTGTNAFTATWDDVGYYGSHTNLLNAFQLILTDVGGAGDFDIRFIYEDMNWTTGDASGGSAGTQETGQITMNFRNQAIKRKCLPLSQQAISAFRENIFSRYVTDKSLSPPALSPNQRHFRFWGLVF